MGCVRRVAPNGYPQNSDPTVLSVTTEKVVVRLSARCRAICCYPIEMEPDSLRHEQGNEPPRVLPSGGKVIPDDFKNVG
jgi:hypothetical protein